MSSREWRILAVVAGMLWTIGDSVLQAQPEFLGFCSVRLEGRKNLEISDLEVVDGWLALLPQERNELLFYPLDGIADCGDATQPLDVNKMKRVTWATDGGSPTECWEAITVFDESGETPVLYLLCEPDNAREAWIYRVTVERTSSGDSGDPETARDGGLTAKLEPCRPRLPQCGNLSYEAMVWVSGSSAEKDGLLVIPEKYSASRPPRFIRCDDEGALDVELTAKSRERLRSLRISSVTHLGGDCYLGVSFCWKGDWNRRIRKYEGGDDWCDGPHGARSTRLHLVPMTLQGGSPVTLTVHEPIQLVEEWIKVGSDSSPSGHDREFNAEGISVTDLGSSQGRVLILSNDDFPRDAASELRVSKISDSDFAKLAPGCPGLAGLAALESD